MNNYNSTYYRIIIIKPVNVDPIIYVDFNKENDKESPQYKYKNNLK